MRKLAKETSKALKSLGATETINSGATQKNGDGFIKLDNYRTSIFNGFLIEAKFTEKLGFRITKDTLDKIKKEGYDNNQMGVLLVGFIDKDKHSEEFIMMDVNAFAWMVDQLRDVKGKK